jgi:Zn-dependent metalloprotease
MALNQYAQWDRYQQINIDLSDVLGTPGIDTAQSLAERLAEAPGVAAAANRAGEEPFVVAETTSPLSAAPTDELGFLAADSGFLDLGESSVDAPAARVVRQTTSATGTHILAQQEVRGAELIGCRFAIHYRPGEADFVVTGRPAGEIAAFDPGPEPDVSEDQARAAALEHFELDPQQPAKVELVVFPTAGRGRWAFECKIPLREEPIDIRVYLDARDHSLLVSYNVASAALHGEAAVYSVNPRRTPELRVEALWGLGPVPPDQLSGDVFVVQPHTGEAFRNALRDCRLTPDEAGFDEVQAWFHLSHAQEYFRQLVRPDMFTIPPFKPLSVTVHDPRAVGNAYFKPDLGQLWLGDFGHNPSARSADVVFHELSHAVADAICRLGRALKNSPPRGMSEGFADYFAASALGDPRMGDYVAANDDGARRLDKPGLSLAAVAGQSEHRPGEVWGAILWGIRSQLGRSIADLLAAESLNYLGPQAGYPGGLAALQRADRELFPANDGNARHSDVIQAEFDARQ